MSSNSVSCEAWPSLRAKFITRTRYENRLPSSCSSAVLARRTRGSRSPESSSCAHVVLGLLAAVQLGVRDLAPRTRAWMSSILVSTPRVLLVPRGLDVLPRDVRVLLAQLAQLGAHPLALLVLALAIELALDDVVIDQVLDQLAELDVVELVVEQHEVDEQRRPCPGARGSSGRRPACRARRSRRAPCMLSTSWASVFCSALRSRSLEQQVVDHGDDVEPHRRRQRGLGGGHALSASAPSPRRDLSVGGQVGQADREDLLGGDLGLAAQLGRLAAHELGVDLGRPDDVAACAGPRHRARP